MEKETDEGKPNCIPWVYLEPGKYACFTYFIPNNCSLFNAGSRSLAIPTAF